MSSFAYGKRRSTAVASTWEEEWRSSWRGVIDIGKRLGRLLQGFEFIAVLAVEHGPAHRGTFRTEGVRGLEVLRLFCGPALFGEGGDRRGRAGLWLGGKFALQPQNIQDFFERAFGDSG